MLCSRLERLERLTERRYIAEPKLDGQRAQAHIRDGRTMACYSRPGRDLLRHPGMAWLRVRGPWTLPCLTVKPARGRTRGYPRGLRGAQPGRRRHQFSRLRDLLARDGQDICV